MGFLRERDFSRDQPCETRLLVRLESHMVSWEKFAEVVGTRRVSGERHVLYLTSYVHTDQVWSRMSHETGLVRRDHGLAVSSCVSSRKVSQRDATLGASNGALLVNFFFENLDPSYRSFYLGIPSEKKPKGQ